MKTLTFWYAKKPWCCCCAEICTVSPHLASFFCRKERCVCSRSLTHFSAPALQSLSMFSPIDSTLLSSSIPPSSSLPAVARSFPSTSLVSTPLSFIEPFSPTLLQILYLCLYLQKFFCCCCCCFDFVTFLLMFFSLLFFNPFLPHKCILSFHSSFQLPALCSSFFEFLKQHPVLRHSTHKHTHKYTHTRCSSLTLMFSFLLLSSLLVIPSASLPIRRYLCQIHKCITSWLRHQQYIYSVYMYCTYIHIP